ncbi:MAG TPA: hypothetical protein VG323_04110, partial [Thermoanaerobaculia bacterium]|nr:hypothetical protein [Thermoanaerobaculia bacterium]
LPGFLGALFLIGLACNGIVLYLAGVARVPLVFWVLPVASAVALLFRRPARPRGSRDSLPGTTALALPLVALVAAAAILPIRDYDGRVTWLPKAQAIAHDHAIDGPFFHGAQGYNPHNHYPLLMPLDDATVLALSHDGESVRWIYVLVVVSLFLVMRDFLSEWIVAGAAWLPILLALDGGALAAYNDFAICAFAGMALLLPGARPLFLAALVLTKNEGAVLAAAIVVALLVTRRARWPIAIAPLLAAALLALWRMRIPAAYDEQYGVLLRDLPHVLGRFPAALLALARHACDVREWGWFWPWTFAAAVIALVRRRAAEIALPALVIVLAVFADTLALTVTSWQIEELASVAANRLLVQLLVPACAIVAYAIAPESPSPKSAIR